MFQAIISPILSLSLSHTHTHTHTHTVYSLWYNAPKKLLLVTLSPAKTSSVHYTTSCKHSLVFLRMGEIIAQNMLS